MTPGRRPSDRSPVSRAVWLVAGLIAIALGTVGIIVPGLPTTVFFIVAAACFSKSSERLEQWVLDLPKIGPMVRDYRAGLGMPRRAKVAATGTISVVVAASVVLFLESSAVKVVVVAAGVIGICVILWRVPTREAVQAELANPHDRT